MAKVLRVVLDSQGIKDFLRSDDVSKFIADEAENVRKAAGDTENYTVKSFKGFDRAHSHIKTRGWGGYRDNLKNNTLLKAQEVLKND